MNRAIFWAFLLLLGSALLGATVFRDRIAQAAGSAMADKPTAPVEEQNLDANGNIRVHEQGTASVTGTLSLSGNANTVKIDPSANTVALSSADRDKLDTANGHLAGIDSATGKLTFDSSGNLRTASPEPAAATKLYYAGDGASQYVLNDHNFHTYTFPSSIRASFIYVDGSDDDLEIVFKNGSERTLDLFGSGWPNGGSDSFHLLLNQPIPMDRVQFLCENASSNCAFVFDVIGS